MHNAFDAVQIIKDSTVKIESIGLWGPRLLVGCMDGSLRIYAPDSLLDDGGDYGYSRQQGEEEEKEKEHEQQQLTLKPSSSRQSLYVLRDTRIGFSKKAVVAMDVLQSRSLLISLSDAVFVHTLPDFDVVAHLTKSKGASMYAWDEERGMLCVAKAKRLFLYRYDGKPYTHPSPVFLPLLLLLELSISLSFSIASLIWIWSNASASIHRLQLTSSSIKECTKMCRRICFFSNAKGNSIVTGIGADQFPFLRGLGTCRSASQKQESDSCSCCRSEVLLVGFVGKNPPSSGSRWLLSVQIVTKIVQQQAMGFVVSFSEFFFQNSGCHFFREQGFHRGEGAASSGCCEVHGMVRRVTVFGNQA